MTIAFLEGFMKFGDLLLMIRTRQHLTREELSKKSGVSVRAIAYYELDGMNPKSHKTIDLLAKALDVTSDELTGLAERYADVPDYAEKEAWYVKERMPASMIKGGENVDPSALLELAERSIDAYLDLAKTAEKDESNLSGLKAFRERMVTEGNPSSGTMNKVLGEEGQEKFFREYVMPMADNN